MKNDSPMKGMTRFERHTSTLIRRARAGFTLVEILLVLAIIMILATIGIINIDKIFGDTQDKVASFQVNETFKTPLLKYRLDVRNYPSSSEGLDVLMKRPAAGSKSWKGPYVDQVPLDPWKNAYRYRFPGEKNQGGYDLWSIGPDGMDGTPDDIGNWQKAEQS